MARGPDQWTSWLDRHGPALLLFARQWLPCRADAEDVVQEAFVRFWRSRQRANDPTAYIFACVKRCALDWQRSHRRRSRREEAIARREGDTLFLPAIEQDERRRSIEAALNTLPEEQREVLVLKIWGELSFPQIAVALSIAVNTAASRYRYALAKLRQQLAEEPIP